jgi:dimethylargininase
MTRSMRAIVRAPPQNFAEGLTTESLGSPDYPVALRQHAAYVDALRRCGLDVTTLPADPRYPDSVFVEDTAILVGHSAIVTRPGAPSRTGETADMTEILGRFFSTVRMIEPPGTLDGGDVCDSGDRVFIGLSERTNEAGAVQLSNFLEAEGRIPTLVDIRHVPGVLHLKSAIASIGDDRLVTIEALAENVAFADFEIVPVAAGERYAANCVRANDFILIAAGFPELAASLASLGYPTLALAMSEFRKMDGGLSCLSLRW